MVDQGHGVHFYTALPPKPAVLLRRKSSVQLTTMRIAITVARFVAGCNQLEYRSHYENLARHLAITYRSRSLLVTGQHDAGNHGPAKSVYGTPEPAIARGGHCETMVGGVTHHVAETAD